MRVDAELSSSPSKKGYAGKRARSWITLTKAGRAALAEEIAQLELLISHAKHPGTPPD